MFRFKFSLLSHGVALAALILLTQACTTGIDPNAKPVDSYGHLQIANGKLTSEKTGSPVQLTGMSLYWSNWGSAWWNESAVDQAVDYLGCKILRAPMAVGQHENGVPVDAKGGYLSDPVANKARLKRVVDQAIYRGIYVIIDWHDHAAETHKDQAVAFFTEMAKEYGNVPNVLFEIYNEPITTDWSGTIKPYAEEVIAAIRNINGSNGQPTQNVIIVGTPNYSQQVDQAANDQIAGSNIAYTLHFYSASHPLSNWQTKLNDSLAKGIAIVVTEWGVCDAFGGMWFDLDESDKWLAWMQTNQISWSNWDVFDKAEGGSMFLPGTSPVGPWSDADLTDGRGLPGHEVSPEPGWTYSPSGVYMKSKLPVPITQLFASPSLLTFSPGGGTQNTTVTNKGTSTWKSTSGDTSWLHVSSEDHTSGIIGITADPYDSTTVNRTGTISLDDGNRHTARVLVTQRFNGGNIALGQPTWASSLEDPSYPAAAATDGDETNTRWSSKASDPQCIAVDLGQPYSIGRVNLFWEAAYSSSYHIQLSSDPPVVDCSTKTCVIDCSQGTWQDIYASGPITNATLGVHEDPVSINSTISGRYIRMYSDTRIGSYGNSLWEFEVFAAAQ